MTTERHAFLALKRRLPGAYLVRIENAVGVGLPDVYGACAGQSFWVELKVGHLNRRRLLHVERRRLLPSQFAICTRLRTAGVPVYLGILVAPRIYLLCFRPEVWECLGDGGIEPLDAYAPGERKEP